MNIIAVMMRCSELLLPDYPSFSHQLLLHVDKLPYHSLGETSWWTQSVYSVTNIQDRKTQPERR